MLIEGIAVALAGRGTHRQDVTIFIEPMPLNIGGDIDPDDIAADTIRGRALCPQVAAGDTNYRRITECEAAVLARRHF
jgi:hypothetical protein